MRPKTSLPDYLTRFCQQPSQGSTEKLGDEFFSCNFADYTLFFSVNFEDKSSLQYIIILEPTITDSKNNSDLI